MTECVWGKHHSVYPSGCALCFQQIKAPFSSIFDIVVHEENGVLSCFYGSLESLGRVYICVHYISLSIIYLQLENKTQKSCFSKIVCVEKHVCICKPL